LPQKFRKTIFALAQAFRVSEPLKAFFFDSINLEILIKNPMQKTKHQNVMKNKLFKVLTFILALQFSTNLSATNLFWIGGTGNWSDQTHWSATSGGAAGAVIPTSTDNVFFDANSFSGAGQIVTINVNSACNDMNWTGAGFSPAFNGTPFVRFDIYGSLTLVAGMTMPSFFANLYFSSTAPGKTITTAGVAIIQTPGANVYFDGVGGTWTLQDAFTTNSFVYLNNGTLNTNNKTLSCQVFNSSNSNVRTLNLGSSTVNLSGGTTNWDASVSTNFNLNAGTSTINFTSGSGYLQGGTLSYNNVMFTGAGSSYGLYSGLSYNKVIYSGSGFLAAATGAYFAFVEFQGTALSTINQYSASFGKVIFAGDADILQSNTFDSLIFTAGKTYRLGSTQTQTINYLMQSNGSCTSPVTIKSATTGTVTNISSTSATITANYLNMQDINANGGATFIANNSIDLGNNTGWTINAPAAQNFYWIGGNGNWDDANHWSATSGGTASTCIPNRYNNVYFDANSFTAGSKIVTLNVTAECDSMNWTGATNNPIFTGSNNISIYGSLKFISAMTNSITGKVYFTSTNSGNTITSAGKSFTNEVHFNGVNGDWTLQDALSASSTTGTVYLDNGYLVTNDKALTCYSFASWNTNVRGLYLGSSTVTVTGNTDTQGDPAWGISGANFTIDAGTSLIKFTAANSINFNGGTTGAYYYDLLFQDATTFMATISTGAGFNNVTFNSFSTVSNANAIFNKVVFTKDALFSGGAAGHSFAKATFLANSYFQAGNSFDTLVLSPGKAYTFCVNGALATTINNQFVANGTCNLPIIFQSGSVGTQALINSSLSSVILNYIQLQDIKGGGGATFTANSSTDLGNNSGWTINAPVTQNLYWVGHSGNWNDPNHWSLTSGGAGGACVPTLADNVFFDASSFSVGSKIVTLNVNAYCRNMTWTGATFTPVLTGTTTLNVYGSLTLINAMNVTGFTGFLNFKSNTTGNTITSATHTFSKDVHFDGIGGSWILQDAFNTTTGSLYLDNGTLNTNNKNLSTTFFFSINTNNRGLILGSSLVTITGSSSGIEWQATGTNLSLNAGTSTIKFLGGAGSSLNIDGGLNKNYYNIIFQDATVDGYIFAGSSFHNVTFNGTADLSGNTFNKVTFNGNTNQLNTGSIIDSLIFSPSSTNNFAAATITTINSYLMADGTAGNLTKLYGVGTYTLSKASCTVCCNYIDVKNCTVNGGASFYADNSTNNAGNTGWNFASCPSSTLTVGPIAGATNTCINTTGNVYSIPSLGSGATYTWTVSGGPIITSGQGTSSIQVTTIGSTAGTISVTASACGNTNGAGKAITINPIPSISSVSVTPATCSHNDGSATATITGGSSPYKYQWSSGDTLALADSLYSGQYQLNVSDLYGCVTSTGVTVNSSNGPVISLSGSANVDCAGGSTGSLTVSVTGGVTPYTYAWTSGSTTNHANNLIAGNYVVTVTDAGGCRTVSSYVIAQSTPINIPFTVTPSSCTSSTGVIATNVSGGISGYTYLWSANAASQTTATVTALAAGLYSVIVTDNAGCTKTGSVMVNTNTAGASIALDNIDAGTCGTNGPGGIYITTSGGAFPYAFHWSNGGSTEDITGIAPGTYSLGVVDANGCMTFATYSVPNANPNYQPEICLVTFDTTSGSNLIAWDKTGAVGIQAYNIYCEIGSYNNYQLVGTVPAGNLSEYIHVGANPDVKSWKYKISAIDSCGTETPLSSYHKTIHLQISQGSGGIQNLSWDNYYGFNYGGFEVWRHTLTTNWVQLTSIPFCGFTICSNTYTDFTPVIGDTNRYAILVTPPSSCVTTARLANPNGTLSTITKSRSNVKNNRTSGGGIGITETEFKNKFSVYPNPATNEITIQLSKDCNNCTLEISNALGQTLKSEKLLSLDNKINIAGFANGVYYVKVKSNNSAQHVQKIVVQH